MDSVSGGPSGGAGSDCEGEEQEDPSSSSKVMEAGEALDNLTLDDVPKKSNDEEDALTAFRQQWQRELESTPSPQRQLPKVDERTEQPSTDSNEEKAKQLFLKGVELERSGRVFEAVQEYRRAVTLCPDVERRVYRTAASAAVDRDGTPAESVDSEVGVSDVEEERTEEEKEKEEVADLVTRLQRIMDREGRLCEPEVPQQTVHISCLPREVWTAVLRWTVSAELDAGSLERAAAVCRGLYLLARDHHLWRALCCRTWGVECGTPKAYGFESWRAMYIDRPRLLLNGCYISKTTYLRHGENAYQDTFYKPWYLIEYYRYLRFFPEGVVLMWTTAEEPGACVSQLRQRQAARAPGVLEGHYRLLQDKVVIVVKKSSGDKKPAQASNTRFRSRRKDSSAEQHEQIFHLELQLRSTRSRRNNQLGWLGYWVSSRRGRSAFELVPGQFPPFAFSRVRSYTADATAPLM